MNFRLFTRQHRSYYPWQEKFLIVAVLLFLVLVSGCAIVRLDASRDASSCESLSGTIPQGTAGVPLRLVHAVQDSGSALMVNQEHVGVDESRRCVVRHSYIR